MMSQGGKTVSEFLSSMKSVYDELAMVQAPVAKDDLIIYVINGLSLNFQPIAMVIRARDSPIIFEELSNKLMDFELNVLNQQDGNDSQSIMANVAVKGKQNNYPRNNYRQQRSNSDQNNNSNNNSRRNNRTTNQLYG